MNKIVSLLILITSLSHDLSSSSRRCWQAHWDRPCCRNSISPVLFLWLFRGNVPLVLQLAHVVLVFVVHIDREKAVVVRFSNAIDSS